MQAQRACNLRHLRAEFPTSANREFFGASRELNRTIREIEGANALNRAALGQQRDRSQRGSAVPVFRQRAAGGRQISDVLTHLDASDWRRTNLSAVPALSAVRLSGRIRLTWRRQTDFEHRRGEILCEISTSSHGIGWNVKMPLCRVLKTLSRQHGAPSTRSARGGMRVDRSWWPRSHCSVAQPPAGRPIPRFDHAQDQLRWW